MTYKPFTKNTSKQSKIDQVPNSYSTFPLEYKRLYLKIAERYPEWGSRKIITESLLTGGKELSRSEDSESMARLVTNLTSEMKIHRCQYRDMEAALQEIIQTNNVLLKICSTLYNLQEDRLTEGPAANVFMSGLKGYTPEIYRPLLTPIKKVYPTKEEYDRPEPKAPVTIDDDLLNNPSRPSSRMNHPSSQKISLDQEYRNQLRQALDQRKGN